MIKVYFIAIFINKTPASLSIFFHSIILMIKVYFIAKRVFSKKNFFWCISKSANLNDYKNKKTNNQSYHHHHYHNSNHNNNHNYNNNHKH